MISSRIFERDHPYPQRKPGQSEDDWINSWFGLSEGFLFCRGCGCHIEPGYERDHYMSFHAWTQGSSAKEPQE